MNETNRLLGLVFRKAGDDPMLFSLAVAQWARSQPPQTVQSLASALLEESLSEELENLLLAKREVSFRKRELLAWMEGIAEDTPKLLSRVVLQYVQALPLEHLRPFARFLAAAESLDALRRELEGKGNGQPSS